MCRSNGKSIGPPDLDPLQVDRRDGFVYGRGSIDDKSAIGGNLRRETCPLQKGRLKPDRDIIVALTADEEGGTLMAADCC